MLIFSVVCSVFFKCFFYVSTQIFLTSRYKFYMSRHNLHWAIIILSTAYNYFSCVRKVFCLVLVSCSCCFLYSWRTLSSLTFDPFCLLRVCVCVMKRVSLSRRYATLTSDGCGVLRGRSHQLNMYTSEGPPPVDEEIILPVLHM